VSNFEIASGLVFIIFSDRSLDRTAANAMYGTGAMQNDHWKSRSNKRGKKRNRRFASFLESDRGLLAVFIASAVIVSISTLVVPWTLESGADYELTPGQYHHHSITTQLKRQSASAKSPLKKNSADVKSSPTRNQNAGAVTVPDIKEIDEKSTIDESASAKPPLKKNSVDVKSSPTRNQNAGAVTVPDIKEIDEKNTIDEGFFLTRSTPYHTIFSTGCSIFQDWQSYVFFYHVFRSGQEGHITRIASGCHNKDAILLDELFKKEIKSMRPSTHHLHQTPDFSKIPKKENKKFKYFNKPYGVRHWMQHALGYPENHKLHDDSIIILMDPDQIMLRPFTNDFTNSSENWRSDKKRKLKVEHGSPFAQQYGYGMQWKNKVKLENVFQGDNFPSPISNLTPGDAQDYYSAMGPVSEIVLLRHACTTNYTML
jgi:hypothetical protein